MESSAEFIPQYRYEDLEKILKESTEKARDGKLDLEGKLYGIAAGYAMDFVDTSRTVKKPLDLTGRTEDNVFSCLTQVCAGNIAEKKSMSENRADMVKKFGSYQLFALVNSMNCGDKTTEIAVQEGNAIREARLVIRSVRSKDGKVHTFDVYDAAESLISTLTIFDPDKSKGAVLFGQMAPFYKKFERELMRYLVES